MFGLGFAEILIIAVIAILFLGPDKLPSAMVDVAKFFRSVKKTIGTVKDSIEQEMNVSEIKEEALAYKKELLKASEDLSKATDMTQVGAELTNLKDDMMAESPKPSAPKAPITPEKITFEKKIKEDSTNV
ncbi:Sec-independent protein translocase protein TatB [bacterium]|nr:Sec-independent protein translocase protein TatB [bacterium]MBU1994965.1 Sec-independent protein translocase protein TatB [bacterium]